MNTHREICPRWFPGARFCCSPRFWHSQLRWLLGLAAYPACLCLFQPVPSLQTARTLFWIQRPNISVVKLPSPKGTLPASGQACTPLPACALHPKALPLLLMLRDYFPVVIRTQMWYSPGRCSWQKCQLFPQDWKYGWLERKWPLPSLNQYVPPDSASWPCPGQTGTQHFVLAGKEELK